MATQFACRTPGCDGQVRGSSASNLLTCPLCGREYRRSKKVAQSGHADRSDEEEEPLELPPIVSPRKQADRQAKRRSARERSSAAGDFISANLPFLLTRVLPALVVLAVFFSLGISLTRSRWVAKESAKLAEVLWNEVRGSALNREAQPYVRGRLAILETQSEVELMMQNGNLPQQWLNNSIPPPLENPQEIGSVIVVEWKVFADTVRDSTGRELGVRGADGPAMLKRWRCKVKLIDRKLHTIVYESQLEPPDKTFDSGDRLLTTPSTRVTPEQLAAEFDKIRKLPAIALDGEPPGAPQPRLLELKPAQPTAPVPLDGAL